MGRSAMRWRRHGLVFRQDGSLGAWAAHSALQPTPLLMDDRIRVYCGFRDAAGTSSVGYVDLDRGDPTRVLGVSGEPALAPGPAGAFDEAGVVPCAIVEHEDGLRLYYAGYVRSDEPGERFRVYSGLATSDDGERFTRASDEPLMAPTEEAPLFRVVHSVVRDGDGWRCFYGAGGEFRQGREKLLPVYDIRQCRSSDGMAFPEAGEVAIGLSGDEHRVGRPYVVRGDGAGGGWEMYFGAGSEDVAYRLAFARSGDGERWTRDDAALGLEVPADGFDAQMQAYPAVVRVDGRTLLLWNGDGYGRAGFGLAERID